MEENKLKNDKKNLEIEQKKPKINVEDFVSLKYMEHPLSNAILILEYAAEHGIDVDKEDITSISKVKHLINTKKWTEKLETEFWISYKNISKEILPVNINSIQASKVRKRDKNNFFTKIFGLKTKLSLARLSVLHFITFTVTALIIMVILLFYMVIGKTLLSNIENCRIKLDNNYKRQVELMQISDNALGKNATYEISILETEFDRTEKEYHSSIKLLNNWLVYNYFRQTEDKKENVSTPNVVPAPPGQQLSEKNQVDHNIMDIQTAKNLITMLSVYVLPLLLGALGGCTYVLRTLIDETKAMIFTEGSKIEYLLKVVLGAVAGLITSIMLNSEVDIQQLGFVRSLSPLAIAFIVGYSVDILFTIIDKLIRSVTKSYVTPKEIAKQQIKKQ